MKIVFMGSPEFAVPSLQALIDSRHEVIAVFTQPPRPAGRGQKLRNTPVHDLAKQNDISVFTPKFLGKKSVPILQELNPDLICVAAYGLILPQTVLDIAPCVNVHPSALPRWRGAAPMNHTILAGDTTTDMCIMQMEAGLDTGPVYLREHVAIDPNETTGDLHDRMAKLGAACMAKVINHFPAYEKKLKKQAWWKRSVYAHKFLPEDLPILRAIDFTKPAQLVHNKVRGLSPWPVATCKHTDTEGKETELKMLRSEIIATDPVKIGKPGEVIMADSQNGLVVACKKNAIRFTQIQRPGKKAMADTEVLNGFDAIKVGDIFI